MRRPRRQRRAGAPRTWWRCSTATEGKWWPSRPGRPAMGVPPARQKKDAAPAEPGGPAALGTLAALEKPRHAGRLQDGPRRTAQSRLARGEVRSPTDGAGTWLCLWKRPNRLRFHASRRGPPGRSPVGWIGRGLRGGAMSPAIGSKRNFSALIVNPLKSFPWPSRGRNGLYSPPCADWGTRRIAGRSRHGRAGADGVHHLDYGNERSGQDHARPLLCIIARCWRAAHAGSSSMSMTRARS